jgi:ectoine hydroxylase-related dioxygenase (phytanoyl-CoA dioxygenase family)
MSGTSSTDPAVLEQLDKKGFAVVPGVLSKEAAAEMRDHLIRAIKAQDHTWGDFPHYLDRNMAHNLMMHGQPFVDLLSNPKLHAYLSKALDPYCTLYAYTSSSIPVGGGNYSSRIHVDSPRFIPGYVTNVGFIVALDDFSLDNGATYFLPGSHLSDRVPTEDEFFANAERALPEAGDGVIFNARTFHFGGHNKTNRDRHAVTLNVCRSWMRQRFDYPRLMPREMVDAMPDVGKRFIGWNVRVPSSLEQYYVAPDQRLYKTGQG